MWWKCILKMNTVFSLFSSVKVIQNGKVVSTVPIFFSCIPFWICEEQFDLLKKPFFFNSLFSAAFLEYQNICCTNNRTQYKTNKACCFKSTERGRESRTHRTKKNILQTQKVEKWNCKQTLVYTQFRTKRIKNRNMESILGSDSAVCVCVFMRALFCYV